jgi:RimJ/RimL family protein N-acetyltransferase
VEPLQPSHAAALFSADALDKDGRSWTYLPYGPFDTVEHYRTWLEGKAPSEDPMFFAICTDRPVGFASYLRIDAVQGSIEVGHLHFSPVLQRTPAATEAMYLMMRNAFELGYRRYEWKCNSLNAASGRAAQRLGFVPEGVFRQAGVTRGHSRDTAWFSIIDSEWPRVRAALEAWLDPSNFDAEGRQRRTLESLR